MLIHTRKKKLGQTPFCQTFIGLSPTHAVARTKFNFGSTEIEGAKNSLKNKTLNTDHFLR